jgi:hypothetical protein
MLSRGVIPIPPAMGTLFPAVSSSGKLLRGPIASLSPGRSFREHRPTRRGCSCRAPRPEGSGHALPDRWPGSNCGSQAAGVDRYGRPHRSVAAQRRGGHELKREHVLPFQGHRSNPDRYFRRAHRLAGSHSPEENRLKQGRPGAHSASPRRRFTQTGMRHVFVNGVQVLRDGEHTGATPGNVIWGPGVGRCSALTSAGRGFAHHTP